jgi:hypothetical protein
MTIAENAPRPDQGEAGEIILKIGFEGGSHTILGIKAADGWRFRLVRDETTFRDLLQAEYTQGLELWHQSDWVNSFDTALALLDPNPWHMLCPLEVHSDFRDQVWATVEERRRNEPDDWWRDLHLNDWWRDLYLNDWRQLCHVEANPPEEL